MTCKLKVFPWPNDPTEYPWDELILGIPGFSTDDCSAIDDFWPLAVDKLNSYRNVDVNGPEDAAWFHLRRTRHPNEEKEQQQYALCRIEILRLEKNSIPEDLKEEIRCIPEKYPNVICAGWRGAKFDPPHDNAFLSFVQKLSVLRTIGGMVYLRNLIEMSNNPYDKCPVCQEAYTIMTSPNEPWFTPLTPWFEYFASANLPTVLTHEYAHWFGHILSSW